MTAEKKINQRIKIIGCGKMASAILDAWLKKSISTQNIYVDDPNPSEWLIDKKKQDQLKNESLADAYQKVYNKDA